MRLRTEKGTKVVGNLLHVSSYRASNIIHTECWSVVGWTTRKTLPFGFCPILITSCLRTKGTMQALHAIHIRVLGEPGNEASSPHLHNFNVCAPECGILEMRLGILWTWCASVNLKHEDMKQTAGNIASFQGLPQFCFSVWIQYKYMKVEDSKPLPLPCNTEHKPKSKKQVVVRKTFGRTKKSWANCKFQPPPT